jgi:hypothetical protein
LWRLLIVQDAEKTDTKWNVFFNPGLGNGYCLRDSLVHYAHRWGTGGLCVKAGYTRYPRQEVKEKNTKNRKEN